jgi:uncharacterized membrane protein YccC
MNNEFMEVSTSLHAFEQLLRRQRNSAHPEVSAALHAMYQALGTVMSVDDHSARTEQEALQVASQLAVFRAAFANRLQVVRQQLPQDMEAAERLDFETGAELLYRLTDELYVYTRTYGALASQDNAGPISASPDHAPRLEMHFDPLAVALAGVRGALALAILSAIWIFTDWRSGIEAITIGIVTSTLFATTPSPTHTIKQFMLGAVIGTLWAYLCNFHWLTQAHGFTMLAIAVSPGILLATWLTTRPQTAIVGAGFFIVYLMHIGFNSSFSANPITFMNDAIADLLAVLVSGIMYGLIDLSSSRWSRLRISKALRGLVVAACREPLALRRARLETGARDLVQRAGSAQRIGEKEDRIVVEWLLSALEIGHAVIALREHLQTINAPATTQPLSNSLEAIARLYDTPSQQHRIAAIEAVKHAMENLRIDALGEKLPQSTHRQITTMLHFIHSALLDQESVLASGTSPTLETS